MKIKKRTRNIILISVGVLICLFIFQNYNFEKDRKSFENIIILAGNGDVKTAFEKMEENKSLTNPVINYSYQDWRTKMYTRFTTDEEIIENTSKNKIVNDISTIYRAYWKSELLKETKDRTDSTLYTNITNYILENNLTSLSTDSLKQTIKNDIELGRILKEQGFKTRFMYRNGFQDLIIWDQETINKHEVILPKDTIITTVIFIESYHLNGYDNYATISKSSVGGWAMKESATLYCNKSHYDLNSEKFKISYLKHESIHFTDLNEYPNLSSADLEYRAKVIELMYCTKKTVHIRISEFINGASSKERTHSHPYANYSLIKGMSKILFDSEYESDFDKWKNTSVEEINKAATQLYNQSESTLLEDKNVKEII